MKRPHLLIFLLHFSLLTVSCAPPPVPSALSTSAPAAQARELPVSPHGTLTAAEPPDYWPTDDWRIALPSEHGLDEAILDEMLASIRQRNLPLHSLLIIRDGYLVSETYFNGYTPDQRHEIFSCTKSLSLLAKS